jgi:cephalosporin-C deacetylase
MPLTFDLSLNELKKYKGITPCPKDFDAYWEKALTDMRALDPKLELVPASFQVPGVECFDMYFSGVNGARIYTKFLRPAKIEKPCPVVLMFHGYACNSSDWSHKLNYVSQGFIVAAMDCRGQGGLSEDTGGVHGNTLNGHIIRGLTDGLEGNAEKLLYRSIFLDTAQLAKIVMEMPEVDESRVYATGWSQGGALTVACAGLEPRIKKAAPVYPFLSDYKRVWEMDLAVDAYAELKEYFRRFDPQHKKEDQIFETLGYVDVQNLAGRIKAEVLWGTGLMDTICPPSTQFAAYNKVKSQKRMAIFPDFRHEELPGLNDEIMQFFLAD